MALKREFYIQTSSKYHFQFCPKKVCLVKGWYFGLVAKIRVCLVIENEIVLTNLVKETVYLLFSTSKWDEQILTLYFWFHNFFKLQGTERNQMNNKVAWLLKTFKYSALHSWADWLKLNRWDRVIDSVELLLKRSRPSLKKITIQERNYY